MNQSTDQTFLIGIDLVEFDRRDLPIYQTEPASFDCTDEMTYGAPLDRLFGEPGDVHVDGAMARQTHEAVSFVEDPLVDMAALSDGLPFGGPDVSAAPPDVDFSDAVHPVVQAHDPVVHLHDGWSWDFSGADWTFDAQG